MESDVARLAAIYKFWAWVETNWKKVAWIGGVLAVAILVVWFYVWRQGEQEVSASEALSNLRPAPAASGAPAAISAEAYLKVANEYPKTGGGARAVLLAADALFTEGKYAEAKAQFDRFLRDHAQHPLRGQAMLGSAASLGAQGKAAEAAAAYDDLIKRHPGNPVVPRAKFALARLYETQNRTDDALKYYEELTRSEAYSSVGAEAEIRLQELRRFIQPPITIAPITIPTPGTNITVPQTNKP